MSSTRWEIEGIFEYGACEAPLDILNRARNGLVKNVLGQETSMQKFVGQKRWSETVSGQKNRLKAGKQEDLGRDSD